jgi:hypothetical protein
VSRAGQAPPAIPRMLPRGLKQNSSLIDLSVMPSVPRAEVRSTGRLPINLRSFLAAQLGCRTEASDDTILSFAAQADRLTLNKLARAIRRYSTARAHEAWAECRLGVTAFVDAIQLYRQVTLCLRCVRVEFGDAAVDGHQRSGCVPITLARAQDCAPCQIPAEEVPEIMQRLVEEFRALRSAFGLPHFDLDCYVRGGQVNLMWRPLP